MIDQIDERLQTWVESVLGAIPVELTPPRAVQTDPVVHLYLMQIVPALAAPEANRLPRQIMLSYLVAVRAADPLKAHKLLGDLVFAALDNPEFNLDYTPLPLDTWIALGIEPQPAFMLKIPLSRERVTPDVPLVRQPLVTRPTSITSLQGVVVGPKDLPLQGALVELPALHQYQRTDSHGHFRFPTVPVEPLVKTVRVSGRGHELEVSVDTSAEPLVIRLFEESDS